MHIYINSAKVSLPILFTLRNDRIFNNLFRSMNFKLLSSLGYHELNHRQQVQKMIRS